MIFFPSTQIFWKLWECTLLKIYIYIYIFKKNQLKNAQLFYCWIDIVRWFSYLDIMTRACGHKQLCSSFFYHANGTVFTTDDSMSVLISLLLLLCFVFFKIMPTLLLRHILGLEKSTAACFQPPFARTVQAQHWSTPKRKPSSLWRKTSSFLSEHSLSCTVGGDLMPGVFGVSHQQKSQLG